jgi:hypothetical protein
MSRLPPAPSPERALALAKSLNPAARIQEVRGIRSQLAIAQVPAGASGFGFLELAQGSGRSRREAFVGLCEALEARGGKA